MDKTRIVVTVLGADRCGIVAAVAGALSECNANIVDISQTIQVQREDVFRFMHRI